MNNYFKFKEFTIEQEHCAMKVGTDGVLIGAWAAVGAGRTLDIGCGSGLISLIIAQRESKAKITAIDLDEGAIKQSEININNSDWSDRIEVKQISLQEFTAESGFNYIVSNPPYFINSLSAPNKERTLARHTDSLPFTDLASGVSRLLSEKGIFSLILPYVEANIFVVEAAKHNLFCTKRIDIKGRANKPVKRVMMQFEKERKELISEEMIIEDGGRHEYSQKYRELTKDFYLKF